MKRFRVFLLWVAWSSLYASAAPTTIRWTGSEDKNADFAHVVDVLRTKSGLKLDAAEFLSIEDRDLATSHFKMYAQTTAGVPMKNLSVRMWTDLTTKNVIQVEATIDKRVSEKALSDLSARDRLTDVETMKWVRARIKVHPDDNQIRSVSWRDEWQGDRLVRVVKVKGRAGVHKISFSLISKKIVDEVYEQFPQSDRGEERGKAAEFDIPVQIYPIYEEVEGGGGTLQPRVSGALKYISGSVAKVTGNPYSPLAASRYLESKYDPVLGLTVEGRKKGFWSMVYVKDQATAIYAKLPTQANDYSTGAILEGRYTTVSLNPDALKSFSGISFKPGISAAFKPDWQMTPEKPAQMEMIPATALLGRPITSAADAWNRVARRDAKHDPATYINDGFDELQVYWAVTQLFESLRPMGFVDPELSTRRFNAFLYDPAIEYRDNAFYTDDTINFTTYSPSAPNFARDNSTIWHELGHGVMDRLMGDLIQLADTGGLSEGMADFVAQLVINDVTGGKTFAGKEKLRIFNHTGFYLTNEVHDDGEAYGGSMNDMLVAAMTKWGRGGLTKMTDLTLEAMRLTRNNPALTAVGWFEHMLFADELGRAGVRAPGEMKSLILGALAGRNFSLNGSATAELVLKNKGTEVEAGGWGSRQKPIPIKLGESETATYKLTVNLKNSAQYAFKFPVTVKVSLRGGPIQGAIHWNGEEHSPLSYTLASETDSLSVDLTVTGKCDEANRPDGSCVDYAYVQIWNQGELVKPQAKKRFYLRVMPTKGAPPQAE